MPNNTNRYITPARGRAAINAVLDYADEKRPLSLTVQGVRTLNAVAPAVIATTDMGGGIWNLDESDTTTADNTGTVLVTPKGDRYKRVYSGAVSPEWFGADDSGSVDTTEILQGIIDSGFKDIYFGDSSKSYLCGRLNVGASGVTIRGDGATFKLRPGFSSYQWLRVFSQQVFTSSAVSVPLAVGQNIINTDLAANMQPGDIVRLDGPVKYQDQAAVGDGGTYNYGLYTRVRSISGNDVTVEFPSRDAFTATTIFIYRPTQGVNVQGVQFDTNGIAAVSVVNFEDTIACGITNCVLSATGSAVGVVLRGINLTAGRNVISGFNHVAYNNTGYGVSVAGHGLRLTGNYIRDCKHNMASGARAFLCEGVYYDNNIVHNSLLPAIDMHANVLGGSITNNEVYTDNDATAGIQVRGSGIDVIGNKITMNRSASTATLQMFGIRSFEMFDGNCTIAHNKIYIYNDYGTVSPLFMGLNSNTIVHIRNLNIYGNYSNCGNYNFEGIYDGAVNVYNNTLDGYKAETGGGFTLRGTCNGLDIHHNDITNRYTASASLNYTLDSLVPANLDQKRFTNFRDNSIRIYAAGNMGRVIIRSTCGIFTGNRFYSDFNVAYFTDVSTTKENYFYGNERIDSAGTIVPTGNYAALPTAGPFFSGKFAGLENSTTIRVYYCEKTATDTYVWKLVDKSFNPVTGDFSVLRTGVTAQKTLLSNTADSNLIASQSPTNSAKGLKIRATTDDLNTPATGGSAFIALQVMGTTPVNVIEGGVQFSGLVRVMTAPVTSAGTYRILTRDISTLNVEQIELDSVLQRKVTVDDSLTTAQTSATLTAAYPYAGFNNIIIARNVSPGMLYVRINTTLWLAFAGAIA